ncbi:uncharacterized protein LOC121454710 [Microtus oregoni]|uniref:uncharacterized protein LOC121454710 n=1 Tax=Microtus oregoni TaxID=111838 RepID=UPI001BB20F44|nr:uncharacterized protein LOC121454710 [Microtus oregoni]
MAPYSQSPAPDVEASRCLGQWREGPHKSPWLFLGWNRTSPVPPGAKAKNHQNTDSRKPLWTSQGRLTSSRLFSSRGERRGHLSHCNQTQQTALKRGWGITLNVQCARAAAGVRVPAFPFLPAAPLTVRVASGPQGPGSRGSQGEARSGVEAEEWQHPPASGPRTARRSPSEAGGEQAARRQRLPEAAGPARRPPRLFPFSLHPLLHPARPAGKPDRFAAAAGPAVGTSAGVVVGNRAHVLCGGGQHLMILA